MMKRIRIGNGRPRLHFGEGRWGEHQNTLTTNGYGYIESQMWALMQAYQHPVTMYPWEREDFQTVTGVVFKEPPNGLKDFPTPPKMSDEARKEFIKKMEQTKVYKRVGRLLSLTGREFPCTVWEFNAYGKATKDSQEYIRFMAPFGEQYIVRWNIFDVMLLGIFRMTARVWNKTVARIFPKHVHPSQR